MHGQTRIAALDDADDGEVFDLRDLLDTLIEGRWIIAAAAGLALLVSLIYLWVASPIYQADGLVQVELRQKGLDAALGDLGELMGGGTVPVSAELELVKSRLVVGRVVDALYLEISARPHYFPGIGKSIARRFKPTAEQPLRGSWLGMSSFAWGGEKLDITRLELPEDLVGDELTLTATAEGYEIADEDGNLVLTGTVGVPAETMLGDQKVAAFVQELRAHPGTRFTVIHHPRADVIRDLQEGMRVAEKGRLSGIISVTYEHTDPALAVGVVNETLKAYQDQNVERRSAEAAQTLEFLNQQLPKLREKVETAEGALNKFRLKQGSADLTKETELVLQQSVTIEGTRLELEQKKEELLRRFTKDHPTVQAVDAQLAQLAREQDTIAGRVRNLPETQQELLRLARDVQVSTDLYTALLNNAQELQIAKAGTVGNVRIIDRAQHPTRPAKPKKGLTLALSVMLGLMAGVVLLFLRIALKHGVHDPAAVERAMGIANYAVIPYTGAERKQWLRKNGGTKKVLVLSTPQDLAVEALRSLRTALHFALVDARNNIVMLTGPAPGVGKSFVTMNLGALMAASGKKIVVLDADMRRGHLHEYVGTSREPGLSDYIAGDIALDAIVRPSGIDGLGLVSAGTVPPNPAELLLNERFAELLKALGKQYDYVLVDTPPVLAVTDASIVGALAGTTLLVLKAGEHPIRAIEEAVRRLRHANAELKGTVFNQVHSQSRRYGHRYGYGYQYAYGPAERGKKA
jgi:tyrosine-protein kinase Etk/Wzc